MRPGLSKVTHLRACMHACTVHMPALCYPVSGRGRDRPHAGGSAGGTAPPSDPPGSPARWPSARRASGRWSKSATRCRYARAPGRGSPPPQTPGPGGALDPLFKACAARLGHRWVVHRGRQRACFIMSRSSSSGSCVRSQLLLRTRMHLTLGAVLWQRGRRSRSAQGQRRLLAACHAHRIWPLMLCVLDESVPRKENTAAPCPPCARPMRGLANWPAGCHSACYPVRPQPCSGQPHLSLLDVQDRAQAAVIVASGLEDLESSSGTFARLFISVDCLREGAQRQVRDACHANRY